MPNKPNKRQQRMLILVSGAQIPESSVRVGPCCPVSGLETAEAVRAFFDGFRERVAPDMQELALARWKGEQALCRGFRD